jgi:hypothetical protein
MEELKYMRNKAEMLWEMKEMLIGGKYCGIEKNMLKKSTEHFLSTNFKGLSEEEKELFQLKNEIEHLEKTHEIDMKESSRRNRLDECIADSQAQQAGLARQIERQTKTDNETFFIILGIIAIFVFLFALAQAL